MIKIKEKISYIYKTFNRIMLNYYIIIDKFKDKNFRYKLKMKILNKIKLKYYLYYFNILKRN